MKKEVMEKWVAALRSGEYEQTDSTLRCQINPNDLSYSFCCLGVLTDICRKETGKSWEELTIESDDMLNNPVIEWAGIKTLDKHTRKDREKLCIEDEYLGVFLTKKGKKRLLTELNDTGKSFNYIATVIEKNYERM